MMNSAAMGARYRRIIIDYHAWRAGSGIAVKLLLAASLAVLTGVMAQVSIPLPWTPVPLTLQTFAVILGGLLLGRWGAVGQVIYVCAGVAGLPWFAGARGGAAVLLGPTAGYLVGFVVAAYLIGSLVDRGRTAFPSLALAVAFVNLFLILGIGAGYLWLWLSFFQGRDAGLVDILGMGVLPFIPGAVIKTLLALAAARALFPGGAAENSE
ncbi:MAG: biotin transporter BioY [Spirochaetes bacterium]|nr:biotin transporter BioY [Spirochaetota bacterium]